MLSNLTVSACTVATNTKTKKLLPQQSAEQLSVLVTSWAASSGGSLQGWCCSGCQDSILGPAPCSRWGGGPGNEAAEELRRRLHMWTTNMWGKKKKKKKMRSLSSAQPQPQHCPLWVWTAPYISQRSAVMTLEAYYVDNTNLNQKHLQLPAVVLCRTLAAAHPGRKLGAGAVRGHSIDQYVHWQSVVHVFLLTHFFGHSSDFSWTPSSDHFHFYTSVNVYVSLSPRR